MAIVLGFCALFFVICGCILLLDTVRALNIREGARTQISRVFFGTILAGFAAALLFLLSPETLNVAIKQASEERGRAIVAEAQTEAVIDELREIPQENVNSPGSVVFLHTYQNTRREDAVRISETIVDSGRLAPGIDGLDVRVSSDQVRYFHKSAKAEAEIVAGLAGIDRATFVDGFQNRVGVEHFEIWLTP
ncbi:MAG: hypothetical protein ABJ370_14995 [Paracoccaceae bacterium]